MNGFDAAIIGGGASGTLLAEQLLKRMPGARVALVDRDGRFARGVAYSTPDPTHLLNVRASSMSGDAEDPADFVQWLAREGHPWGPDDFVPRGIYGDYLRQRFAALLRRRSQQLDLFMAEVVDLEQGPAGAVIRLNDGRVIAAERVVLATGNEAPAPLRVPDDGLFRTRAYVASPWIAGALDQVDPSAEVLLVGTGLTAVDVMLSLRRRYHAGKIRAVSRHGRLPQPHAPAVLPPSKFDPSEAGGLRALLRQVRDTSRRGDWRAALDALRPHTGSLWAALSDAEKGRFLRHLRNLWDTHRHRMAPDVAAAVDELRANGQLEVIRGRLRRFHSDGRRVRAVLSHGGSQLEVPADLVVNCTGPAGPGSEGDALGAALMRRGLARRDRHRLGLETRNGALVDANGVASEWLFAMGNLRRAELWETTAMPELRAQAAELAERLARLHASEPLIENVGGWM